MVHPSGSLIAHPIDSYGASARMLLVVGIPTLVGLTALWSLWRARGRVKSAPVFIALTIATVYALFKGFIWPDGTSRYPIIDGALMLAGFLVATRGRLDLLFGGDSLRDGVVEHPRRNRLILGGVVIGVALCAIFDLSTR